MPVPTHTQQVIDYGHLPLAELNEQFTKIERKIEIKTRELERRVSERMLATTYPFREEHKKLETMNRKRVHLALAIARKVNP